MSKYLLKFIEYILPSSKDCTGVGLLSHREVYPHSTGISKENIILSIELKLKPLTQTKTYYCKRTTRDEGILGIRKETRARLLSLQIGTLVTAQDIFISVTHGGILF